MRIDDDATSTVLLLLSYLLIIKSYSAPCSANPLLSDCTNQSYVPNSAFESNLKILLSHISSNTTTMSNGFYNYSSGNDTNQVYGLALCRGNVSLEVCQSCLENASREILHLCRKKQEATIWYEHCQIRYSYQRFFSQMVYSGKLPPWNDHQGINMRNPGQFSLIRKVLNELINQVASNSSERRFATREVTFPGTGKVLGLVECTSDISSDDCETCLQDAMGDLDGCCSLRQGGMVLDRSCNLMFQVSIEEGLRVVKIVICVAIPVFILLASYFGCFFYQWRRKGRQEGENRDMKQGDPVDDFSELPLVDFDTVKVATGSFSDSNKLGQGGFGIVYKGTLPGGKEIAVKRLSRGSRQGLEEFKNEALLIVRLQHRNLVRLLGCGIEGEEKLLIYEFMPNNSLDDFFFDPIKRSQLDWRTRYNIIDGIARGLVYLHEGSRLKIIHRDLKTSNVLLDKEMTAKISDFEISDFGLARILCEDQNTAHTHRIVGTYGYMSPEYAMEGIFSVKSDVFSFGVILLEIISGKRNNSYLEAYGQTLLAYVWRLWEEGKELDFVDPFLSSSCSRTQVLRCIHIGLLCVQRDPADRPTMSDVIVMLESDFMDH